MAIWLLILVGFVGGRCELVDRVDVIEVNHWRSNGVWSVQWVAWEFDWRTGGDRVVAWRMMGAEGLEPRWNCRLGCWESRWFDEKTKRWRRVFSGVFRESWTEEDVEILDRGVLPIEYRRGLRE